MTYEPTGFGWAHVEFHVAGRSARLSPSLTEADDPLAVLLCATTNLLAGRGPQGYAALCRFPNDGGVWVLDLWAHNDDLGVLIHWSDAGPESRMNSVLEGQCSLSAFAWAVWAEASRQTVELGREGYSMRASGFAFPSDHLAELHRNLVRLDARPLASTTARPSPLRIASGR